MITTSILVDRKADFEAFVSKMNKKAIRFNCPLVEYSFGETFLHEDEESGDNFLFVEVNIEESKITIPGYTIAGVVEKVENSILIHTSDDKYLGMFKNTSTSICHHCGVSRERNKVVILQGENEIIQVGTTCLKDFTGHSSAVQYANIMTNFFNQEIMEQFQSGSSPVIPVKEILEVTCLIVRKIGFVSKAKAEEQMILSTADEVREYFFSKSLKKEKPQSCDIEKASEISNWISSLEDTNNNFLFNLHQLFNVGFLKSKHFGILVAAIPAFNRFVESEQEKTISEFIGNIGDKKVKFTGRCVKVLFFDTMYGLMKKYIFNVGGNVVTYSTNLTFCNEGEEVSFIGTIKNYSIYKEVKQTEVTRCRIV